MKAKIIYILVTAINTFLANLTEPFWVGLRLPEEENGYNPFAVFNGLLYLGIFIYLISFLFAKLPWKKSK